MFFDKLIRNIFIFLMVFIITINIYFWSIAIQFGTENEFHMVSFMAFFKNFEKMPHFEVFAQSMEHFMEITTDWNGWRGALAIITLGISTVAEFCEKLTTTVICLLVDFIRIIVWLFGFLGYNWDSPILNQ